METAIRKRKPQEIDIQVGYNLNCLRTALGLSQAELAEAINVSVGQIQKYEKGQNRISASRLYIFSQILGCELTEFFQGCQKGKIAVPQIQPNSQQEAKIINTLRQVKDPTTYQLILRLIENLAKNN